jgi:hypothetical protein
MHIKNLVSPIDSFTAHHPKDKNVVSATMNCSFNSCERILIVSPMKVKGRPRGSLIFELHST